MEAFGGISCAFHGRMFWETGIFAAPLTASSGIAHGLPCPFVRMLHMSFASLESMAFFALMTEILQAYFGCSMGTIEILRFAMRRARVSVTMPEHRPFSTKENKVRTNWGIQKMFGSNPSRSHRVISMECVLLQLSRIAIGISAKSNIYMVSLSAQGLSQGVIRTYRTLNSYTISKSSFSMGPPTTASSVLPSKTSSIQFLSEFSWISR